MTVSEKQIEVKRKKFIHPTMILAYSIITVRHRQKSDADVFERKPVGNVLLGLSVDPIGLEKYTGIYVTISEIWFDDKRIEGFVKQTLELSAYREGDIKLLFTGEIDLGTYRSMTLVLDYESDAEGNAPGCYSLNERNEKYSLESNGSKEYKTELSKGLKVCSGKTTELVVHTQMKSFEGVFAEQQCAVDQGTLPASPQFRIFNREECGVVKGEVNRTFGSSNEMYVLAFRQGTFAGVQEFADVEKKSSLFSEAEACSKVKPYGSYQLSLLEEGKYEFHIASICHRSGRVNFYNATIHSSSNIPGVFLKNINVTAQSQVQLNIDILSVI